MSAVLGAIGGALGLIVLDAAVQGQGGREVSGLMKIAAGAERVLVDPTVPLIPDRSANKTKKG